MNRLSQIAIALLIPLTLALAWVGGQHRADEASAKILYTISGDLTGLHKVADNIYEGTSRKDPQQKLYVATASQPGYGGPLEVAAVIDAGGNVIATSIVESSDTRSYLERIVGAGILKAFVDSSVTKKTDVDVVARASISSTAIIRGLQSAVADVAEKEFHQAATHIDTAPATPEKSKLVAICLFFAAAWIITTKWVKKKKQARYALLICSVAVLGFWLGSQFSLATVVTLLQGTWLAGMATYATLLCLVLTIVVYLITKKNLFCVYICPFGAVQEGIGKITGCKAPVRQKWMTWIVRLWVYLVLLAALYYQAPSFASYDPFGMAFSFIGSSIIYGMTILIVIASLFLKQPWCRLFCPTSVLISYLQFSRKAFTPPRRVQTTIKPVEES